MESESDSDGVTPRTPLSQGCAALLHRKSSKRKRVYIVTAALWIFSRACMARLRHARLDVPDFSFVAGADLMDTSTRETFVGTAKRCRSHSPGRSEAKKVS